MIWIPEMGDAGWELPGAVATGWGFGGRRTMHELAVAIAASGRRVELRGDVDVEELHLLAHAAGAMPELPTEPRSPGRGDVVLMPEGGTHNSLAFARVGLSGARAIIMLLAPTGLFGWPLVDGWAWPSPTTVPFASLAQPEHFHAMAGLGFELWTHMPRMVECVQAAGLPCAFIGNGRPMPYPQPLPKRYDVATLAVSRWTPQAREVVERLDGGVTHREIAGSTNDQVLELLGQARVLIHPTRIEGNSRLGCEARAMGTVPVVLNSNPFAVGLDDAGGAVAVGSVEEMPGAVMALLGDPQRLGELGQRGMRTARAQVDWDTYVARVDDALRRPYGDHPTRAARAAIGREILAREVAARGQRAALERLEVGLERLEARREQCERERDAAVEALHAAQATISAMSDTRAWRLAKTFWRARFLAARAGDRIQKRGDGPAAGW